MGIKTIIITDLNLAATLTALEYKLISLDRSNAKRVGFVFEDSQEIKQSINDYWDEKIELPALTLFNAQKLLKNRLYSA